MILDFLKKYSLIIFISILVPVNFFVFFYYPHSQTIGYTVIDKSDGQIESVHSKSHDEYVLNFYYQKKWDNGKIETNYTQDSFFYKSLEIGAHYTIKNPSFKEYSYYYDFYDWFVFPLLLIDLIFCGWFFMGLLDA